MKNEKKLPLAILAHARPIHLKETLKQVLSQKNLEDYDIYLFVDGLGPKSSQKKKKDHQEVIEMVKAFSGGHKVVKYISPQNLGVLKAFKTLSEMVFKENEAFIYLEEDIVPLSPDYLGFMNEALHFYKEDKRVYAVNGFSFAEIKEFSPPEGFFVPRFCPWGFGTWKDRMEDFSWDLSPIKKKKWSPLFWWRFEKESWGWGYTLAVYTFFPFLRKWIEPWDILFCLHHSLKGHKSYFPKDSYIYNAGLDNSGLHSTIPLMQFKISPEKGREGRESICFPRLNNLDLTVRNQMAKRMIPFFRKKAFASAWGLIRKGAFCRKKGNIS